MKMKVTLAQFYPKLGNLEDNLKRHLEIIDELKSKTRLLIFPELSLTGYNLMDLTLAVAQEKDSHLLNSFLEASRDIGIILGLVELGESGFSYNSAFYYYDGDLRHIHRKIYPPTYTLFDEVRYLSKGENLEPADTPWGKVGIVICEDAWHPTIPFLLAQKGIKILIVLSNSPSRGFNPDTGIPRSASIWCALTSLYSQLYSCYVIYVNRVGFEDGLNFWGGSHIVNPRGEVIAQCPYFEESIVDAELDLDLVPVARVTDPYIREERVDLILKELEKLKNVR
jgi:predicted amidohydrolase